MRSHASAFTIRCERDAAVRRRRTLCVQACNRFTSCSSLSAGFVLTSRLQAVSAAHNAGRHPRKWDARPDPGGSAGLHLLSNSKIRTYTFHSIRTVDIRRVSARGTKHLHKHKTKEYKLIRLIRSVYYHHEFVSCAAFNDRATAAVNLGVCTHTASRIYIIQLNRVVTHCVDCLFVHTCACICA